MRTFKKTVHTDSGQPVLRVPARSGPALRQVRIFAGRGSSRELAVEVCAALGVQLNRAFIGTGLDGEIDIMIQDEVRAGGERPGRLLALEPSS